MDKKLQETIRAPKACYSQAASGAVVSCLRCLIFCRFTNPPTVMRWCGSTLKRLTRGLANGLLGSFGGNLTTTSRAEDRMGLPFESRLTSGAMGFGLGGLGRQMTSSLPIC